MHLAITSANINRIVNKKIQVMQKSHILSASASALAISPNPEYALAHYKLLALAYCLGINQFHLSGANVQEIKAFIDKELQSPLDITNPTFWPIRPSL
jgi:hypothetical protein